MTSRISRVLLAATMLLSLLVIPVLPSSAATVTEVFYVPTDVQDGALIRVEVRRDDSFDRVGQGVILGLSPYNTLSDPGSGALGGNIAASKYNNIGIANAQADVLGTRGSTGCWDYGGLAEQQAGVDTVNFLAGLIPDVDGNYLGDSDPDDGVYDGWSNGRVGMTGVSYDGTTANMVADAAPDALKAIVPIAAISHWYGYAYSNGMRYFLNSESATDEGFDTPLLFDHGFGDTVHLDNPDTITARAAECDFIAHEQQAYSRNPDYTSFWEERDYRLGAPGWKANTLIVHGWNDYNVKQYEATSLYEALAPYADDPTTDDVVEGFDLRMWMTQSRHANGNGDGYSQMLEGFWKANLLEGAAAAEGQVVLDNFPNVRSMAETTTGAGTVTFSDTWPPAGTETHSLFLNRTYEQDIPGVTVPGPGTGEVGELSYINNFSGPLAGRGGSYGASSSWVDSGATSEEISRTDPWSNDGQKLDTLGGQGYYSLAFSTPELTETVRIAGAAELDGYFSFAAPIGGGTITPILVDIDANDRYKTIQRGFMNTDYREGLQSSAGAPSGMFTTTIAFLPEDYTVPKGHRIGLILQSSNDVWALPGNPQGLVTVHLGGEDFDGTRLNLPLVGASEQVFTDFAQAG